MRIGSLFTGYGGLDMAAEQAFDARTVWTSDIDPGACRIIAHRFPDVPNLGDITKIDWAAVAPVDILTGGFPCTDVSLAGKRAGMRPDTRSGLWTHMAYAIAQLRPRYVVAENVRGLLSASADSDLEPCPWCMGEAADGQPVLRALGSVLGDLAALGYDAQWTCLRAADVGAPHGRARIFIAATDADSRRGAVSGGDWWGFPYVAGLPDLRTEDLATDTRGEAGQFGTGLRAAEPTGKRWRRPDHHGAPDVAHANGINLQGRDPDQDAAGPGSGPVGCGAGGNGAIADAPGDGRQQGRPESARLVGGPDAAQRGHAATDTLAERRWPTRRDDRLRTPGLEPRDIAWGAYEPAIRRWERTLGRPAPPPTEASQRGTQRLSPRFVEWMQGLEPGWVTDVPGLGRNAQLKALGNGVVPQQAEAALRLMLDQLVAP